MSEGSAPGEARDPRPAGASGSVEWRKSTGDLRLEAGVRYSELIPSPAGEAGETGSDGEPVAAISRSSGRDVGDEPRAAISPSPSTHKEDGVRAPPNSREPKPIPEAISRWETEGGTAC